MSRSDGSPATGLSEGERTAVTLVHFLEEVARRDPRRPRAVVVIDDPVSSLDSNVFAGMSHHIWSRCVADGLAGQLFVLTHDFELFRQWRIMIQGAQRAKVAGGTYELRARFGPDAGRRTDIIGLATGSTTRPLMLSAYHHAFALLAEAQQSLAEDDSTENRLRAQLLFPNVLRRVLETFLAFRCPQHVGDFGESMRRVLEDVDGLTGHEAVRASSMRVHLTRFAHQFSHAESPETGRTIAPGELGSTLTQAFAFMSLLDDAHFSGLCRATGCDREALLATAPPGASDAGVRRPSPA